jgi:hypothetical protein
MRILRYLAVTSLTAGFLAIVACQEPTQVTIDVRLATAKCSEIHGTAINVGVFPSDTEEKVKSKFPNAQTTDCDDATGRIGTLVVTPSDEARASIIVITSYGNRRDPTECQPPMYTDCIVARRQFTFVAHRRLSLPITIDPTCVNVPCDAFSTCRKGFCFSSEAPACEGGGDCLEPGETADGGTDPANAVDGSSPDVVTDGPGAPGDGGDSGPTVIDSGDGATSDGDSGPVAGGISCDANGRIVCAPLGSGCAIDGTKACCSSTAPPTTMCVTTNAGSCPASHPDARWCCSDLDCGAGEKCTPGAATMPRQCCTSPAPDAGAGFAPIFGLVPICPP